MNRIQSILAVMAMTVAASAGAQTLKMAPQVVGVTTYEASTAVNLVVVKPEIKLDSLDPSVFTVNTNGTERNVLSAYPSDSRGAYDPDGQYVALGLEKASGRGLGLSIRSGVWNEAYSLKVGLKKGKVLKVGKQKFTAIDCETDKALKDFLSEADYFDKGTFTGRNTGKSGDVTLTYAAYEPWSLKGDGKENPLVIWLHGGGEGGLDVSITLLGNEVVSLIRPEIQSHFTTEGGAGGAYVLSVQCPTMWMGTSKGFGHGEYPSLYADVLKSCIDDYVDRHPDVDRKRIYLGGCSNGGYMTMHMLIRNPRYFAAAYPTCEAYLDANISDNEIKALAEENIWIVQSYDDTTVDPKTHCIPTFQRMVKAGAKNVWMSMFENVQGIDNPGQPLMGHFSWCYLFNDAVRKSQEQSAGDVKPSNDGGGSVAPQGHANIFEWMNAQVLTDPEPAPQPRRGGGAPARAQKSRIVEEGGSGPYKAVMMEEASLPTHTIFRPQDLSAFGKGKRLPVVVWGNGGCANSPSGHVNFLNEVASQGYLIVAIGPSNYQQVEGPRPGQTGAMPGGRPQMRPGQGGQRPQGAPQGAPQGGERPQMRPGGGMPGGGMPQMPGGMSMGDPAGLKQALEWVLAQNADPASSYYGKLDIDNIAAAGMSCGGLQALHMSDDARIKTILVMNSGFFNGGNDKASLNKMKQKSVIWILGGTTDIAWENGLDDFKQLQGAMPAFLASLDGIGHGGTYMQPFGGDYAKVATAWLDWWLKGDAKAATMFTGPKPGVSQMENWMYLRKNIE